MNPYSTIEPPLKKSQNEPKSSSLELRKKLKKSICPFVSRSARTYDNSRKKNCRKIQNILTFFKNLIKSIPTKKAK